MTPRRKGEPRPPKLWTDAQLWAASPDRVEQRIAEHASWAERIERQPDPGRGLLPKEAARARQAQLDAHARHVGEVERLRAWYDAQAPDAVPETKREGKAPLHE